MADWKPFIESCRPVLVFWDVCIFFLAQVSANTPSMYSQELFQLSQYLQVWNSSDLYWLSVHITSWKAKMFYMHILPLIYKIRKQLKCKLCVYISGSFVLILLFVSFRRPYTESRCWSRSWPLCRGFWPARRKHPRAAGRYQAHKHTAW